jgi:hypothetical protein
VFNRSRVERASQRAAKLGAVGLGSTCRLAAHLSASGLGKLADLIVDALAVGRV